MSISPVKVLPLESVNDPSPVFSNEPAPEITPEMVISLPFVLIVPFTSVCIDIFLAKVTGAPIFKVDVPAKVMFPVPKESAVSKNRTPSDMVVAPEYVLFPDKVSVPAPVLFKPPMPVTLPETIRLRSAPISNRLFVFNSTGLAKVAVFWSPSLNLTPSLFIPLIVHLSAEISAVLA